MRNAYVHSDPIAQDMQIAMNKACEAINELKTGIDDIYEGNEEAATVQRRLAIRLLEDAANLIGD